MKIYVVYEAREGFNPEPLFAFHAKSLAAAKTMKNVYLISRSKKSFIVVRKR